MAVASFGPPDATSAATDRLMAARRGLSVRLPVALLILVCRVVMAQPTAPAALGVLDGEIGASFIVVSAVRELPTGKVLVLDADDLLLAVADFATGAVARVGRVGAGPGEYGWPTRLFPLAAGSTAVRDDRYGRLLVLDEVGRPVTTLDANGNPIGSAIRRPRILASDTSGRFYGVARAASGASRSSETIIVRWSRNSESVDTVARFPASEAGQPRLQVDGLTFSAPSSRAFEASRQWVVGSDGRIAVLHPTPYFVQLFQPDGSLEEGPSVPFTPIRVSDRHKDEYRAAARRPRTGIQVTEEQGRMTSSVVRVPGPMREPQWPDVLPPYLQNAAVFGWDGLLWVRRTTPAGALPVHDVFDRHGRRTTQVTLPVHGRIVGFGRDHVYVARVDRDDLQFLQRYRRP